MGAAKECGQKRHARKGSECGRWVDGDYLKGSCERNWAAHPAEEGRDGENGRKDDDGESSSTGSNDVDTEEILWKPRAMYAGQGFVVAAPEPGMLPMARMPGLIYTIMFFSHAAIGNGLPGMETALLPRTGLGC